MRRPSLRMPHLPLLVFLLSALPLPRASAADTLQIETTIAVSCSRPTKKGDKISVHYRGSLESTGVIFDASYNRGQPITFTLGAGQVIKGWDQGLLDMCPGEARTLTIPSDLAYGDWGSPPVIPGKATLIFETELVDIVGVHQEELTFLSTSTSSLMTSTATGQTFSIATAPSTPPPTEDDKQETPDTESHTELEATPLSAPDDKADPFVAEATGKCHLLGPFALIVQGALGAVALLSLVYKRWRETPKRPWKIFFFDVSKQVLGSVWLHILNLLMSMLGAGDLVNRIAKAAAASGETGSEQARVPNPCSFYLLNLGIDTTIGIPILYLLLKILHIAFRYTPLARPVESIKTGHYGTPPHATWWLKQSLIYFIGLTGMKMFVWLLFAMLPWLPWVGDWALRWTEGNEAIQIAFVMFIFPLIMNVVQYWIIDSFIMEKQGRKEGKGSGPEYQRVLDDEDESVDEDARAFAIDDDEDEEDGKASEGIVRSTKEVNPASVSSYESGRSAEGSRKPSPKTD